MTTLMRRRGRGLGSIVGSIADHVFGWGRRRRRRRYRRRLRLPGLGRRRLTGVGRRRRRRLLFRRRRPMGLGRRYRRHRRGRGFLDTLKKVGSFAAPIVASAVLNKAGSALGSRLFGGRRRRRRTHRIGGCSGFY